jgi:diadenosine tetraphosphatase ApaH/serine/threonine PP2A family protein phosphatase
LRYAIISDIHSNLAALQEVLNVIGNEHIDRVICLGDIVGYGPDPNACMELVQHHCAVIITGNHDFACIESSELFYFNHFAKQAIEWTVTEIADEHLIFISRLPLEAKIETIRFVHANPYEPRSWDYILSLDDAIYNFSKFEEQICFIGHSHQPIIYIENKSGRYAMKHSRQFQLEPESRYIINVGSVGQPRDGNCDAAFGIFDTATGLFELRRVGYNIQATYDKMIAAGLPGFLGERLFQGR